ncbi:MAG: DUF2934 domain-containing protein [Chitinispirillaceae bacterium]|nr:DUF2934 domain-containing protein [Chitinispirillaceae bacterium]
MTTMTFEENVKERAFELFLERGGIHGNDQEDWFRAETELRNKNNAVKPASKSNGRPYHKRRG